MSHSEQAFYTWVDTPLGEFFVAGDADRVSQMSFSTGHQVRRPENGWIRDRAPLERACLQVEEYFAGTRRTFDLRLAMTGTDFQRSVWQELLAIPFGETRSYGDVATALGCPGGAQAVGAANAANHLPLVVPCHRVIGADGSLTGFGGGLDTKRWLLGHEAQQRSLFEVG